MAECKSQRNHCQVPIQLLTKQIIVVEYSCCLHFPHPTFRLNPNDLSDWERKLSQALHTGITNGGDLPGLGMAVRGLAGRIQFFQGNQLGCPKTLVFGGLAW